MDYPEIRNTKKRRATVIRGLLAEGYTYYGTYGKEGISNIVQHLKSQGFKVKAIARYMPEDKTGKVDYLDIFTNK